ncbi:hypothetical protein EDB92DRAFT_1357501 [Lactarius akahatsu]|uniref:Uncharacterized protein n=1 Tax=Lactarius akahatsu TaxID=416441 RepID=A0AAD4LBN4_9AGAM|nr:hypothetical protein EDB92DRAFT_1357501 [Lactarius akahatsu]
MPPEPTFSRSHLSAFRSSLMGTTTVVLRKTRPLPHQAASLAPPSCCHKQRHATRSQSESSPRTASSKDDGAQSTRRPASESQSCTSSPAPSTSSSPPSSPPRSPLSPVPEAKKDPDGTISPATIYQHYACVARRLLERQRRVASSRPNPTASAKTRPSPQGQATAPRALDWPLPTSVGPAPTLALDVTGATMVALDELPVSANCDLPEYQLTQEWFERIVGDLREAEESKAKAAAVAAATTGEDVGTDVDEDAEDEARDKRHPSQK